MSCVECPVCGHNDIWDMGTGCLNCKMRGRPRTRMVSVRYPTMRDMSQTATGQQRLFPREPIWFEDPKDKYGTGFPLPGQICY